MQNLIAINQEGYLPSDFKHAFIAVPVQPKDSFVVIEINKGKAVYKNEIQTGIRQDPATGDDVNVLNFTRLKVPGTYRLWIPRLNITSVEFSIGDAVYAEAVRKTLQSFYYQRCGIEIDVNTPWSHPVCHTGDAVLYENPKKKIDVTGGWHDAGDYGKYSVNTSVSLGFLLYLYDHRPGRFGDTHLNIPEAGNGLSDLLDEARRALDWLVKMQREDGGVFHKVQKKKWTGEYLPHKDPDRRYIFEVSSTATADFAAVAALGARLFREFDEEYALNLEKAGEKAWKFLEQHPEVVPRGGFKNPPGVVGGEYGDRRDQDERLWAAAELYRLTGKEKYHNYFLDNYQDPKVRQTAPLSWKNVAQFAWTSYLRMNGGHQDPDARRFLVEKTIQHADSLVRRVSRSGYRVALEENEYYWGSNSVTLGYAFALVQAFELTGEESYRKAALDQLHYILGRNPFGQSFITGVGDHKATDPYHQFSNELDADRPVPGLLVGGPNSHNQLDNRTLSEYPGRAYEDSQKNYLVNEVAINYTASFVYLAGYFLQPVEVNITISSN